MSAESEGSAGNIKSKLPGEGVIYSSAFFFVGCSFLFCIHKKRKQEAFMLLPRRGALFKTLWTELTISKSTCTTCTYHTHPGDN